jgi:ABC-type antimicrobial peptide transport system, permease component
MLKQNKFFSIISITGTALAIMMIMVIIVTDGIKNISITPEYYRDKTLYLTHSATIDTLGPGSISSHTGSLSYTTIKEYIPLLKTPEMITACGQNSNALVGIEGSDESSSMKVKYIDHVYWKFYSFSFIEGKSFGEEEFLSGLKVAVVSESTAKRLFKGEQALGQSINIGFDLYRITGIVKDVSPIFTQAFSEVWIPYSSLSNTEQAGFDVMLLVKNNKDIKAIKDEFREIEKKYYYDNPQSSLSLRGPETHRIKAMGLYAGDDKEMAEETNIRNRKIWFMLIIIMLVPAINLSGLSMSRIKKRTPEIGVRKAFGAKRHIILVQVLCENLITSFVGGIIGLGLSIIVIFQMKDWLLDIPAGSAIPFNAVISIPVILSVFAVCVIINILSAAIPAYRASRMTIVNSITNNDKQS